MVKGSDCFCKGLCRGDVLVVETQLLHHLLDALDSIFARTYLPMCFSWDNIQEDTVFITPLFQGLTAEGPSRIQS